MNCTLPIVRMLLPNHYSLFKDLTRVVLLSHVTSHSEWFCSSSQFCRSVQLPNGNNLEQGSQAKGRVLYSQPYLNHETIKLISQTKAQADLMFEVATPAYSRKIDDPINAPHWAAPPGRRPIVRSCWLTDTQSLEFHGTKPFADRIMRKIG